MPSFIFNYSIFPSVLSKLGWFFGGFFFWLRKMIICCMLTEKFLCLNVNKLQTWEKKPTKQADNSYHCSNLKYIWIQPQVVVVVYFLCTLFVVHVLVLCFVTSRSNLSYRIAIQNISGKVLNVLLIMCLQNRQTRSIAGWEAGRKSAPFNTLCLSSWKKSECELMALFPAGN